MKKVAINGFGRIGRAYFRLAYDDPNIKVVAVNDLMDVEAAAYLLKYDTTYGNFEGEIEVEGNSIYIDGVEVPFLSIKNPSELPWRSYEVDVAIESTGVFASYEKAYAHTLAGAKHTIISAPVKDAPPKNISAETILVGVNTEVAKTCTITSNASCTTNAVGMPLDILDKKLGIESAILNTIHSYTSTQQLVDGTSKKKTNLRYGRSGAVNIVPSSTGAALATSKALPSLKDKFDGIALRVPTISGSIADVTFISKTKTTKDEVNAILKNGSGGLFTTTDEPIVSSDIVGEPYVAIADLNMTRVVNGNLVKVLFWYDNEIGYTQSLIEHTKNV